MADDREDRDVLDTETLPLSAARSVGTPDVADNPVLDREPSRRPLLRLFTEKHKRVLTLAYHLSPDDNTDFPSGGDLAAVMGGV
jgi:hypothetical protein